jgi:BASS family bile acid:Na+ symporter
VVAGQNFDDPTVVVMVTVVAIVGLGLLMPLARRLSKSPEQPTVEGFQTP